MAPSEVKEAFERQGVVVIRSLIAPVTLTSWRVAWDAFATAGRAVQWNPVAVNGPFPEPLASIYKYQPLLDVVEWVFGPDLALYNHRFVVKDAQAKGSVFWHQDSGYHVGGMTKLSAFVALSECNALNGCLKFLRGSHKFGYLGDAGEIDVDGLKRDWPQADFGSLWYPELQPGDVVLMHSATWHGSVKHTGGPDRVLADCIFQPANDSSGIELVRGHWRCTPQPWLRAANIFTRSRTSRLRELQAQVDKYKDSSITKLVDGE